MSFLTARLWRCHGGRGNGVRDNGDATEDNGVVRISWVSWGHHRGQWGWDDSRGDDGVVGTLWGTWGFSRAQQGHGATTGNIPKGMAESWGHHRGQGDSVGDGTLVQTL